MSEYWVERMVQDVKRTTTMRATHDPELVYVKDYILRERLQDWRIEFPDECKSTEQEPPSAWHYGANRDIRDDGDADSYVLLGTGKEEPPREIQPAAEWLAVRKVLQSDPEFYRVLGWPVPDPQAWNDERNVLNDMVFQDYVHKQRFAKIQLPNGCVIGSVRERNTTTSCCWTHMKYEALRQPHYMLHVQYHVKYTFRCPDEWGGPDIPNAMDIPGVTAGAPAPLRFAITKAYKAHPVPARDCSCTNYVPGLETEFLRVDNARDGALAQPVATDAHELHAPCPYRLGMNVETDETGVGRGHAGLFMRTSKGIVCLT